jgi:hypothetical protein
MKKIIEQLLAIQTLELDSPKKSSTESKAIREQVPADVLNRFDKFLQRGKKGVALVQNGVCKGCQIQIPVGTVNALIQGVGTWTCGNCGRYLYLSEQDAITFQDRNKTEPLRVPKAAVPTLSGKTIRPSRKSRKSVP